MRTRTARLALLLVLVVAGLGAALLVWDAQRRGADLHAAERDVVTRLDAMIDAAAALGSAQQAYVAPGQPDSIWFARATTLLQSLNDDLTALRQRTRSSGAPGVLHELGTRLTELTALDGRVREQLEQSQDLLAADVLFADVGATRSAVTDGLSALRAAERAAFDGLRTEVERTAWGLTAGAAIVWLVGLGLLAQIPAREAEVQLSSPEVDAAPTLLSPHPPHVPAPPPAPITPGLDPLDLEKAADLCTALARLTSTAELPDLLARAAGVLDASGLIVWMSSGDALLAATSYGYDPRVIARLGAITREADNATAASWRTGEVQFVPGDAMTRGAIVAPMFGPDTCVGVLAAEVRHGREAEPSTRAVTVMIAAQLATAIAAWPNVMPEPDHNLAADG